MKHIYHHLGLGDHIINNGMVRFFYRKYGEIALFSKKTNFNNILYMYRDLSYLQVISADNDEEINSSIRENNLDCIKVGFADLYAEMPSLSFDKAFYKLAGLDFSIRFDDFYFQRDLDKEKIVLDTLNPDGEKYVFVHDDPSMGFSIDLNRVNSSYKVIKNDKRFSVLDYISLLENAEEIHFMQSSFKELICSYVMEKPLLFQHNYVRKYPKHLNSSGINEWVEIN